MTQPAASRRGRRAALFALGWLLIAGPVSGLELTAQESAGKRIYREGISAAGGALVATVGVQNLKVSGAAVACANCHGPDGKGRPEGGVRPPEITWRELAKPYGHLHDNGRVHPVFDDASFYRVVTEGLDPAGQRLNPAMPRYLLAQSDTAAIAAYLRRIDDDHDPGIHAERLRIGTLLPLSGPLAESGRLAEKVLQGVFAQVNSGGGLHGRQLELVVGDVAGEPAAVERLLSDDVFAWVGPLIPGGASAVFGRAEAAALPVVGPLAGESGDFRYVFQLAAGEREQGRVLAEFAARQLQLDNPLVVVVAPAEQSALAGAVEAQLASRGWTRVSRQTPGAAWGPVITAWQQGGVKLLFYFGTADDFAALRRSAADAGWQPVFLAPAGRVGGGGLAAGAGMVYLAMPALPDDVTAAGRLALETLRQQQDLPNRQPGLQAAAYAAATVLVEALNRVGRAASRERLVDTLENLYAFETGVMPPIAFGPGRRVGVRGAHVMAAEPLGRRLQTVGGFLQLE